MKLNFIFVLLNICLWIFLVVVAGYVVYLVIKALRKYTRSVPVRKEKAENAKTLGEVLKQHRLNCKMTQEFVAETLGVSRQAVSKWESGASAPSTTNLMALAKVFDVSAEELLKETQKNKKVTGHGVSSNIKTKLRRTGTCLALRFTGICTIIGIRKKR